MRRARARVCPRGAQPSRGTEEDFQQLGLLALPHPSRTTRQPNPPTHPPTHFPPSPQRKSAKRTDVRTGSLDLSQPPRPAPFQTRRRQLFFFDPQAPKAPRSPHTTKQQMSDHVMIPLLPLIPPPPQPAAHQAQAVHAGGAAPPSPQSAPFIPPPPPGIMLPHLALPPPPPPSITTHNPNGEQQPLPPPPPTTTTSRKKSSNSGGGAHGNGNSGRWTVGEHELFLQGLDEHGKGTYIQETNPTHPHLHLLLNPPTCPLHRCLEDDLAPEPPGTSPHPHAQKHTSSLPTHPPTHLSTYLPTPQVPGR